MENPQSLTDRLGFEPDYSYIVHPNGQIEDLEVLEEITVEVIRANTYKVKGRFEEFNEIVQYKFDNSEGPLKLHIAPKNPDSSKSEGPYNAYKIALILWIKNANRFEDYKDY
jgi:hypothetical protein